MTTVLAPILTDSYTPEERALLEARWGIAGAQLDAARRDVEIAIGRLYSLLPDRLGDRAALTGAMVARWVEAAVYDLKCLSIEGELPTGGIR
jgi:hypothetical protein